MSRYKGIIGAAPLLLLIGCTKTVCNVGETPITNRDISFRAKVSEVYYPGSGKDYVGLAQLIKGYLSEEVLKSLGHNVDDAVLEAEAKRINEHTQAPDVLQRVKDVFGRNRNAYMKTFMRIVYAERVLYNEVFLQSKEIHKEQYSTAEKLLKETLKSPASFNKVAKSKRLDAQRLKLSLKDDIIPYGEKRERWPSSPAGVEQAARLISAISKVNPGGVYPEVLEWQEGYQVMRFIRKEGEDFVVDSVSIPKRDFDGWFWERASKIPVVIRDEKLKNELLKEVSWAKNVNLK